MTDTTSATASDVSAGNGSAEAVTDQNDDGYVLSHTLKYPIVAHGDQVSILKWREPTAGDIERAGNPIILEFASGADGPRMTFDEKKMNNMISTLVGIPPSSVKMIKAGDWQSIAYKLSRFFMPATG